VIVTIINLSGRQTADGWVFRPGRDQGAGPGWDGGRRGFGSDRAESRQL